MAENEESKIQRVKNRLTKMHDKLQSKVEDIYEDLQETVHLASPKVNKFVSHLSQAKGDKLKKSESVETINHRSSTRPEDAVERSSSLENLQAPSVEDEPVQKLRLSSKIKILKQMLKRSMNNLDDDTGNELKLSKSEISLLRKELFSNEEDTRHHVKIHTIDVEDGTIRQRKLSRESEAFESDESFKDPASDGEEKHVVVEDDGAVSDTSATSKKSESRSEKEPSTGSPHLELVPTSGGHLPLPCEILERLGNRFPKIKEKSDMVHRYFQRNTRLCDVNKRLKCQIWSSVVTIVLVEAKGLTPMDQDTGSSDPYCKFRLGNEKYKSKVIWRSLNPCWLEQFDLHLYDDQEQLLELTMWDRDKQSKDDFLGRCVIDLSMLEREKTHSIRQDLEDNNGQVFLLLTISGTTSSETITDLTNYQDNPRERKNIEDKYAWHRLDSWNETGSGGVGWLCVKVFGAKGLAAADLGGKSDPFCVLELVNSRLQTHTEYKTLQPNWMKIFTFNVKDITSVLEITVYDEDHDHKVEFLGKLAIPLLNVKNGDKRWYSLKDKKMRARAKGSCPQILLEMTVVWNPIKACVRALNPREDKYMHTEIKFKRQVFLRNVIRLKSIIVWFIEIGKILQACFEWESRIRSFVALLGWIVACYYFEPWMAPFGLLLLFGRNWLFIWLTGGSSYLQQPIDDEELLAEEDDDDPEQDKEEKKSLKERLQAIQEVTQSVQNSIGFMASLGEEVKNLFNFTVPNLSWLAILLLLAASFVLFLIPVRFLLMLWGINKFARKILRPHTIPNNEVLDLLSRVPDDEELLDFRELKTHSNNEPRRDARKKHKVT